MRAVFHIDVRGERLSAFTDAGGYFLMLDREPLANPSRRAWSVALSEPESWISIAKWGTITGVGYFIFASLMTMLVNVLTGGSGDTSGSLAIALPYCGSIFVLFFGLYTAGNKAARERIHIAPGVLSTVFMLLVTQILQLIFTRKFTTTNSSFAVVIVYLLLDLALGLGIGFMGAFYGVKNTLKAAAKAR
jgi:hypothetical protein